MLVHPYHSPLPVHEGTRLIDASLDVIGLLVVDPRVPTLDNVRLVKYDFEKFGRASERKRLIERWEKEVNAAPR